MFEEYERLKIRFLAAFDRLYEKGLLTEAERDEVLELLDTMDDVDAQEFVARVEAIRNRVRQRVAQGEAILPHERFS